MPFTRAGKLHVTMQFWIDPVTGEFQWETSGYQTPADLEQLFRCVENVLQESRNLVADEPPPRAFKPH